MLRTPRLFGFLCFLFLAALFLTGVKAHAQSVPPGSYQNTCKVTGYNRESTVLTADCKRRDGSWNRNTFLRTSNCDMSIGVTNENGNLYCQDRREANARGSFSQTCRNIRQNAEVLMAECKRADGSWKETTIDPHTCRGEDVENDNGNLRCTVRH